MKTASFLIASLIMLPAVALYSLGKLILGAPRVFPGWSQALSLIPGFTGIYLRRAFYRMVVRRLGADASIGFATVFSDPVIEIGRRVYIGLFCSIGAVAIGDDVLIGSHVSIVNGGRHHGFDRLDVPIREQPGDSPRIVIGRDSWVGERAIIMADVGEHCVIGAGAVVTTAIPDYAIAVGVPARVLRYRNEGVEAQRIPNAHMASI